MKKIARLFLYTIFLLTVVVLFIGSCLIALTDGQGAIVFVFSIPAIALLLFFSWIVANNLINVFAVDRRLLLMPKILSLSIALFILFSFLPFLRPIPETFMEILGKTFKYFVGKTPYQYARERSSLPNVLNRKIAKMENRVLNFSDLDVTYAWDKMCILGPYTDNQRAKTVLGIDWNIEDRSEIKYSDAINSLVFLYQGKVNHVVDLKRGIIDFKNLDLCIERERSQFEMSIDRNSRKILSLVN